MVTKKKVLHQATITGEWRTSSAPNGSVTGTERTVHTIEVFEADYYGRGARLYASGHYEIEQRGGGVGPAFGFWSDGNAEAVERWVATIKEHTA